MKPQEIQKINVNMVDLDHAVQKYKGDFTKHGLKISDNFNVWDHVKQFKSVQELADYTHETEKYFPLDEAKHNAFMRHLLRHINTRLEWKTRTGLLLRPKSIEGYEH